MIEDGDRVQLVTLYVRVLLHLAENPKISQETLARRLDVTMRTVQRHLTELEEEDYIQVDRSKKPFQYSIDWTKPVPHIPWLRLIVLHPQVTHALQGMSDLAAEAYRTSIEQGVDAAQALHAVFVEQPKEVTVS